MIFKRQIKDTSMKKFLSLIIVSLIFAGNISAQEYAVKNTSAKDNWFLELPKVGANMNMASDWLFNSGLKDVTSPYIGLSFGKHFTPIFGARVDLGGFYMKNYFPDSKIDKSLKAKYINTNFDLMVNLSNLFGKYKFDRVADIYGIMGVGYTRHLGYENGVSDFGMKSNEFVEGTKNFVNTRLGIQAAFHASELVDINLEANANLIDGTFNYSGRKFNGYVNAMVGVTYKFKKRGFELAEVVEPGLVASLNDEINRQRGEIDNKDKKINQLESDLRDSKNENLALNNRIGELEDQLGNVKANQVVVTYQIGKTDVSKEQLVTIYNVAQLLKENPKTNVEIFAYADAQTGSAKRNKVLTERRAENIVKILTENYGISADRIKTYAYGSEQQVYDNNDWNRVAVIVVK